MTAAILNVGQRLKGRLSIYTITKQIYESVWLARSVPNPRLISPAKFKS